MSHISIKSTRPAEATFGTQQKTATAKSYAQFVESARKGRADTGSRSNSIIVSLKDSAPGVALIGIAIAEAILVEPFRAVRRKLRRRAA